jgi:uncharacterized membrane protein (UPF0182 family)
VSFPPLIPAGPPGRHVVSPALGRWLRRACWALALALLVAAAVTWTTGDYLWLRQLGFARVFRSSYGTRWAVFGVTGGFVALVTGFSAGLARWLRPPSPAPSPPVRSRPAPSPTGPSPAGPSPADTVPPPPLPSTPLIFNKVPPPPVPPAIRRARLVLDRHGGPLLAVLLALTGVAAGMAGMRSWLTWVQFAHRTSFGRRDPQFHLDLSFYVFVYPFLRLVLGYLFAAVLLALVVAVIVHAVEGGLRLRPGDIRVSAGARVQLCTLLGIFMLVKAAAYWLDRYGIEFSSRDVISGGASYTDVNAVLPAKTVLAVVALLCAGLFFAAARRRDPLLPVVGFGLLVLSAVLIGGVYPAAVEHFSVQPHELARETSYLDQQLAGTRRAFGLSQVQASRYPVLTARSPAPGLRLGPLVSAVNSASTDGAATDGAATDGGTAVTGLAAVPARFRATARFWPGKTTSLGSPLARVARLAPFLTLDGNVYPVVTGGQLDWVVDGYTTTSHYPDSATYDATVAAAGSAAPVGPGEGRVDYLRDAVKAVVSATSGRVTLYQWDSSDPILRTWSKAFPGLIRPRATIPAVLRAQLRYPLDLFDLQRQVLARYHVASAAAFYRGRQVWRVAGGVPVSLTLTLPGGMGAEPARTTVFTGAGGHQLAAYLAVPSDPARPGYGTLRLLDVVPGAALPGPEQVQASFRADLATGPMVRAGPLAVLPAGNGFLYAERVYLVAAGRAPALRSVLAGYDGKVGFGATARAALADLAAGGWSRP